jgi:hypothetical protein
MNVEKTKYCASVRKGPKVNGCADVQTLIRNINIAHEKGALFFLAVQLAPLLEEYLKKNGPPSALELETLIALTTKAMVNQ